MFEFDYYDWDEFEEFLENLQTKERIKFATTIAKVEDKGFLIASRQDGLER
ncbi:hypothetical protein [uncultured Lactobacillus sp.]|uniref:hypothetical protein n=1 Tax=uncultured Lactobacillus sp. TaxID=153152 RepID=UPI00258E568B|nr:hypothetical protein [uncultured Lactobacillus sp.]